MELSASPSPAAPYAPPALGPQLAPTQRVARHYFARHPAPDPERWRAIEDPTERLRTGVGETYAYHRSTEEMMTHALADVRDHEVMEPYHGHWERATEVLLEPWRARGRRRALLGAGIALALSFDTWRQLVREQGLAEDQAIELALRLTADATTRT